MKTEKLGGVAGGEGECGDDVAGWLVRERRRLPLPFFTYTAGLALIRTRSCPPVRFTLFLNLCYRNDAYTCTKLS